MIVLLIEGTAQRIYIEDTVVDVESLTPLRTTVPPEQFLGIGNLCLSSSHLRYILNILLEARRLPKDSFDMI